MQSAGVAARVAGRAGRRLLSEGCTPLGSVGVGGSIALLLLMGFVLGAGAASLLFWWRQRRAMRIELEYRNRYGETVRTGLPDVAALVKAAHAHNISRADCAALTAGTELAPALSKGGAPGGGPLALGAASSFKTRDADALRSELSLKEQRAPNSADRHHTNPLAYGASLARSSSGNPFASSEMLPGFNVCRNVACSLNNTPPSARSSHSSPERPRASGLIGTSIHVPAADPASPRISKPLPSAAQSAASASPFTWPSLAGQQAAASSEQQQQAQQAAVHMRSDTVVVLPPGGAPGGAAPPPAAPTVPRARSSDYLAALDSAATNPFETPALRQQQEEEAGLTGGFSGSAGAAAAAPAPSAAAPADAAAAKAAQKQELLQQVQGEEYGDEELDPEWASLLGELDARLQASGQAALSARERAVAIRSLIVATASQSADAALNKAQHDVEAFRRVQAARSAAA